MKKTSLFVAGIITLAFASCGGSQKDASAEAQADSVVTEAQVDSIVAEEVAVDSVVADSSVVAQ